MWSEREEQLIQEYSEEIRRLYHERSKVPLLADLQKECALEAPNFLKIGKKFIIPRKYFVGHRIIVHPFVDFVVLSEYQYLINTLKETSANHIRSNTSPNKEMIDKAISEISEFTEPNYMVVPIAFYVMFHEWSRDSKLPCVDYYKGQAHYSYAGKKLRILWSNKFIHLNEIIIGNSRDGKWYFKPANGNERLTVKFYFEEQLSDPVLLVQTVFRFQSPSPKKVYVIEFPAEIFQ